MNLKKLSERNLIQRDIQRLCWQNQMLRFSSEKLYEGEKVLYVLKILNFEKPKETKVFSSLA